MLLAPSSALIFFVADVLITKTHPQLQPALLRLSAIVSQYFTRRILRLLPSPRQRQSDMNGVNDACDVHDCCGCISS